MNRGLPFISYFPTFPQILHGIHDIMFRLVPSLREEVRVLSEDKERMSRALSAQGTKVSQGDMSVRDEEVERLRHEASTRAATVGRLRGELAVLGAEEERLRKEASARSWEIALLKSQLSSWERWASGRVRPLVYTDTRGNRIVCPIANVMQWRRDLHDQADKIRKLERTIEARDDLANRTMKLYENPRWTISMYTKKAEVAEDLRKAAEEEITVLKRRLERREKEVIDEFLRGPVYSGAVTDVSTMAIRSCVSEMMDQLPEQAGMLEKLSEEYINTLASISVSEGQVADEDPGSTSAFPDQPVEGSSDREEVTISSEESDIDS